MSTIEDAIYYKLSNDSNITSLVSTRIYPIKIDQASAMPAIAYNRISTVPVSALSTAASLASSRFQFDAWSKKASEASNIASKIRSSLEGFIGSILGVTIGGISMIDGFSDYDPDVEIFRESIDFNVWHPM